MVSKVVEPQDPYPTKILDDIFLQNNNHYLLLNLAIGGVLGGKVPEKFRKESMVIDYVRIFQ